MWCIGLGCSIVQIFTFIVLRREMGSWFPSGRNRGNRQSRAWNVFPGGPDPVRTGSDPPQDPVGCACNTTSGPPRPTKTRIFYFVVSTVRYLTRFDFQRSTGNVRNTSVSFFLWGSSTRLHAASFLTGRKKLAHGNGLSITLSRRRLGQIDPSRVPCARPTVSVHPVSL